jgi:NTE family protein
MSDQPALGLVLSGGAARGFAHIGVLKVVEQLGLRVSCIAGTSMGAIIGALHASGFTASEIDELASSLGWRDLIDFSLQTGVLKGDRLHKTLARHLPATFDDLQIPLAVTTTNVETGEEVVLMSGPLPEAVRASSSFPGAFEPVEMNGLTLADGGITNNLPVSAMSLLQCPYVVASDVTPPRRSSYDMNDGGAWWERMVATVRLERRNPMAQMLLRTTDVMQSILTDIQYSLHPADVRIQLDMPQYRIESFREYDAIRDTGEETARAAFMQVARDRPEKLPPGLTPSMVLDRLGG